MKTNKTNTQGSALKGAFSVSENTYVHFSSGNLQYNASKNTWRFAENQYDIIGEDNEKIGQSDYTGWIDLFGWGTGENPTNRSKDYRDYSKPMDMSKKIGSGWRTLSRIELDYIFSERPNAESKFGNASVAGVKGMILLPDEFTLPKGLTFNSGDEGNEYTAEEWIKMESAGAVFLPAAGKRNGSSVSYVGYNGNYWSFTPFGGIYAYDFYFCSRYGDIDCSNRCYGMSVRLVQNQK